MMEDLTTDNNTTDEPVVTSVQCEDQTMFYLADVEPKKRKSRKPVLSSSLKKNNLPITNEDLDKKLQQAEERRNKRYELRSQRTAENRETMLAFAEKVETLSALRHTTQDQKFSRRDPNEKKKYVQLCAEVSNQFEMLTSRYNRDLQIAYQFKESLAGNSTSDESSPKETILTRAQNKNKSKKGNAAVIYTAEMEPKKRKSGCKPVLSSSLKQVNFPLTREDIDRKLLQAEERRNKRLETRSQRNAEKPN